MVSTRSRGRLDKGNTAPVGELSSKKRIELKEAWEQYKKAKASLQYLLTEPLETVEISEAIRGNDRLAKACLFRGIDDPSLFLLTAYIHQGKVEAYCFVCSGDATKLSQITLIKNRYRPESHTMSKKHRSHLAMLLSIHPDCLMDPLKCDLCGFCGRRDVIDAHKAAVHSTTAKGGNTAQSSSVVGCHVQPFAPQISTQTMNTLSEPMTWSEYSQYYAGGNNPQAAIGNPSSTPSKLGNNYSNITDVLASSASPTQVLSRTNPYLLQRPSQSTALSYSNGSSWYYGDYPSHSQTSSTNVLPTRYSAQTTITPYASGHSGAIRPETSAHVWPASYPEQFMATPYDSGNHNNHCRPVHASMSSQTYVTSPFAHTKAPCSSTFPSDRQFVQSAPVSFPFPSFQSHLNVDSSDSWKIQPQNPSMSQSSYGTY